MSHGVLFGYVILAFIKGSLKIGFKTFAIIN
jgi:hypothetical protein